MADDLSVAVERLRTSTQRLNAICDAAARVIRDVEEFLETMHVGVPAWVDIRREHFHDGNHQNYSDVKLSYQRHDSGKFRVVVVTCPSWADSDDDVTVRPWSECSRDQKLESLEKLPELFVELAKQVDKRTIKAEQTVTTVGSLLQLPKKKGA